MDTQTQTPNRAAFLGRLERLLTEREGEERLELVPELRGMLRDSLKVLVADCEAENIPAELLENHCARVRNPADYVGTLIHNPKKVLEHLQALRSLGDDQVFLTAFEPWEERSQSQRGLTSFRFLLAGVDAHGLEKRVTGWLSAMGLNIGPNHWYPYHQPRGQQSVAPAGTVALSPNCKFVAEFIIDCPDATKTAQALQSELRYQLNSLLTHAELPGTIRPDSASLSEHSHHPKGGPDPQEATMAAERQDAELIAALRAFQFSRWSFCSILADTDGNPIQEMASREPGSPLSREARQRIQDILDVSAKLRFNAAPSVASWLERPNSSLDGATPLEWIRLGLTVQLCQAFPRLAAESPANGDSPQGPDGAGR